MTKRVYKLDPIPTIYNGVRYRSRLEARWALFFDAIGLRAQYELDGWEIRPGVAYLADFWLPQIKMFFEVKPTDPEWEEIQKCSGLTQVAECDMLLAVGAPEARFQIRWFDRGGLRDEQYCFAHDRYGDCGFWMVGEQTSQPIGPLTTIEHLPAGPVFHWIDEAYERARSGRFEADTRRTRAQPVTFPADAHEALAEEHAA